MKAVLLFALVVVMLVAVVHITTPCAGPPTLGQTLVRFVASWFLGQPARPRRQDVPELQPEPDLVQDLQQYAIQGPPPEASPMRTAGRDGVPQLDHAAGW